MSTNQCKGHVYLALIEHRLSNNDDIELSYKFEKQHDLSCSGCQQCRMLMEALEDDYAHSGYPIKGLGGIEPFKKYRLYFGENWDLMMEDCDEEETGETK